jgi:AAA domain (dynein-related subfamily)
MPKTSYNQESLGNLLALLSDEYGAVVTTKQISDYCKDHDLPMPWQFMNIKSNRVAWGKYRVSGDNVVSTPVVQTKVATAVRQELETPRVKTLADSFVPDRDPNYVPFGFYNDLKGIIDSKIFYPVYITGLSGNGKTFMAEQACAELGREMIRVNITKETDETDLIGSYELIDGNTAWRDGPVLVAMKRGAVLLLDETDYGSERLLCLQPVLEGKGYFNKKRGEFISPTQGFNVIATANTKGKGSDDGRFIGANVLNEAFLERFAITVEQEYPSLQTEIKIISKLFDSLNTPALSFATNLAKWAELIRKTYKDGAVDEVISTRRLTHIARAYVIWKNKHKAIELCLNRFDDEVKTVYLDFYTKIDANIDRVESATIPADAPKMTKVAPAPVDPGAVRAPAPTPGKIVPPPFSTSALKATPTKSASVSTQINLIKNSMNIASLAIQFKTPISVSDIDDQGMVTVKSHGFSSVIPGNDAAAQRNSKKALSDVVESHQAQKNMTPVSMEDEPDDSDDNSQVPF